MLLISESMKDELSNKKESFNNAEVLKDNDEVQNEEDIELQMRRMHGEMESDDANIHHTKSLSDIRNDVLNIKTVVDFTDSAFQSNQVALDPKDSVNTELESMDKDGSSDITEFELGPLDKNIKDFASNGDDAKHQSNGNKELMNEEKSITLTEKRDDLQEKIK